MEENKIFVERKDGISYYRKTRNYNHKLMLRVTEQMYNDLVQMAEENDTNCTCLIRNLLEKYVEDYKVNKGVENNE